MSGWVQNGNWGHKALNKGQMANRSSPVEMSLTMCSFVTITKWPTIEGEAIFMHYSYVKILCVRTLFQVRKEDVSCLRDPESV